MKKFLTMAKALADETRLRILLALEKEELCACQIGALLKMAPSTVSRHLYLLSQAGLIDKRKCGKWIYCSLPAHPSGEVKTSLSMTFKALTDAERIRRDRVRLKAILQLSLEEVCNPQRPSPISKEKSHE